MTEWKELGVHMDIDIAKLNEIDVNHRGLVGDCRLAMVDFWLKSDTSCSWMKLIVALNSLNYATLAEKTRAEYIPQYKG